MNDNIPVFYIAAPDYTELSSGRKVLHILCDELNRLGYESYVTSNIINPNLWTPKLTSELIALHRKNKRMQIAVYPEIWMDNPLGVPYVIRWLLNRPNFFQKNWFGTFSKEECVWHFMPEFKPPWVDSTHQHLGLIDRSIFNLENVDEEKREGFVIYKNRIEGKEPLPSWISPIEYISIDNPKTPYECSQLYKKSRGLILYERAACVAEAALCGCAVIVREHEQFQTDWIFNSYWKLTTLDNYDNQLIKNASNNSKIVAEIYDKFSILNRFELRKNISDAIYSLKFNYSEDYFKNSLIIENSLREHNAKSFQNAINGWDLILNKFPDNLKVNYYKSLSLIAIGRKTEAIKILVFLSAELKKLNLKGWLDSLILHLDKLIYTSK